MIMNERGLTLAELLVAISIVGLGLAGLAAVVPVASFGVQEGSQLSTATFLAEQRIEQARNAAWTANPAVDCLGIGTSTTPPATTPGCTLVSPNIAAGGVTYADETNIQWGNDTRAGTLTTTPLADGYTRTTRIVQCTAATCGITPNPCPPAAANCTTDMRLVTVTVTYQPLSGAGGAPSTKTVTLQWVVSQK